MRLNIASLAVCLLLFLPPVTVAAEEQFARERLRDLVDMLGSRQEPNERDKQRDKRRRWSPEPGETAASRAAAAKAERRYGGRALAVVRVREGHKVRLLLDGGRVTTVLIRD